ncbi:hypothetical protein, partial [Brucella suis]
MKILINFRLKIGFHFCFHCIFRTPHIATKRSAFLKSDHCYLKFSSAGAANSRFKPAGLRSISLFCRIIQRIEAGSEI